MRGCQQQEYARFNSGAAFPAVPLDGDMFYRTDLDEPFYWDAGRSRWLSTAQHTADFAYLASVTNSLSYIDARLCVLNSWGYSYPWDMCITGLWVNIHTASTCNIAPFIGVTLGSTLVITAAQRAYATNWNTLVAANAVLTLYIQNTATDAHNAQIVLRRTAT